MSTRFSLSMGMSRLTRDGTAEPVSRNQIFRYERGQGNIYLSCSADHVQDLQPYPVDPYSCYNMCVTIHVSTYVWSSPTCKRAWMGQRGMVAIPARVQLDRNNVIFSLYPIVP